MLGTDRDELQRLRGDRCGRVWLTRGQQADPKVAIKLRDRCRACSTAERTATNIVIAPIARVHRAAPHAPCSLLLLPLLPARDARSRDARSRDARSRDARSRACAPFRL